MDRRGRCRTQCGDRALPGPVPTHRHRMEAARGASVWPDQIVQRSRAPASVDRSGVVRTVEHHHHGRHRAEVRTHRRRCDRVRRTPRVHRRRHRAFGDVVGGQADALELGENRPDASSTGAAGRGRSMSSSRTVESPMITSLSGPARRACVHLGHHVAVAAVGDLTRARASSDAEPP